MTRRECLAALAVGRGRDYQTLLLDASSGRVLRVDWPRVERAVPAGSLMKPFIALAYGPAHGYRYPVVECRGCWKPDGHGRLSLAAALAVSCNTYFLKLARDCEVDDVERVAATYSLPPPDSLQPQTWIGLGQPWRVAPLYLLRAYIEMVARRREPGTGQVLDGLRLCAASGTARGIGLDAFAKTGTGPCVHLPKGSGDGYAVGLYPAAAPQYAVLAQVHNGPGSSAARRVGRILAAAVD